MKNKSDTTHPTNFWFGFALGSVSATFLSYFVGTKKGRETTKKFLESLEHMDEEPSHFFEVFKKAIAQIQEELPESDTHTTTSHTATKDHEISPIQSIIEKIRVSTVPATEKKVKRFFVKDGKMINH
ncbi:MAG: YtxH domain-containing protein [bacterium]|nr:YtxH domain-containing protein [bacterium]